MDHSAQPVVTEMHGARRRWPGIPAVATRLVRDLPLLLPVLVLLPLVWQFGQHAVESLTYRWQIDYDEGMVLHSAWRMAQGQNPYPQLRPDFFTSATYPPLYYALTALSLLLTGPALLGGRLISLAATLAIAGLLAAWAATESRSRLAGLLAALLWLSLSPVYVWGLLVKPDLLALCLTVAGLVWARRWPAWPGLLGAALLFGLAFFTKQSALVGPLAVGLWLLARGGPWRSFGLVMAVLLVVPFGLLNLLFEGGLWLHLVIFQQIPWSVGQLRHQFDKLFDTYPWLLLAAVLALGWLAWGRRRWPWPLPVWYLLAALPLVVLINGRATVNYGLLLDLMPPLCLLTAAAIGTARWSAGWRAAPAASIGLLLLMQAVLPNPPSLWYTANRMPSAERADRLDGIAKIVAETPAPILSEDVQLLLRAGKPVAYDDTFMMARAAQRGIWDERQLLADLERQRFGLVLLEYDVTGMPRSPRWSPAALEALRTNYEILHRDAIFVHRPKSLLRQPGTPQTLDFGGQVRLAETATSTTSVRPGGTFRLMVRWQRIAPPTADYQLFVHVIDPAGKRSAQIDVPPSAKPARSWTARERPAAEYPLTLPEDSVPGTYTVLIGLYDPASGQRLPVVREGQALGDAVSIATLEVRASPEP